MRRAILGVLLLSFGIAGTSAADPVTLTSGGGFAYFDGSLTTLHAAGSGFAVDGSGVGSGFVTAFDVGQTVGFEGPFNFVAGPADNGSITKNAMTEEGFVRATLQLSETPFVAQASSDGQFSTRFTMSGLVQLFSGPGLNAGTPLFSQDVTGSGVMSFSAEQTAPGHYVSRSGLTVSFDQGAMPSPTPEPASMFLFGSGFVVAAWRSRRVRRA